MPAGTMIASTSRVKVTGSLSARYKCRSWASGRRGGSPLFRGNLRLAVQRRVERVPAQARALHARRELADAGQCAELAQAGHVDVDIVPGQQVVHLPEEFLDLGHGPALDA